VPAVDTLTFKEREDYTIIGTAVSGVDDEMIVTGGASFGIDTRVPDMLYAAYQKCPAIGGKLVSANIDEVKRLPRCGYRGRETAPTMLPSCNRFCCATQSVALV
jgi:isoquinoline 1-oxidoreductase beta subunit